MCIFVFNKDTMVILKFKIINNNLMKQKLRLMMTMLLLAVMGGALSQTTTTYTFTSKSWAADNGDWTSGKDGNQLTSGRGIQVTTGSDGANATSPVSFDNISKVEVTYSTNASKGAGFIVIQVGNNSSKSFTVTTSGGTTDRTAVFDYSTTESGNVKITVNCTTNSIYIKSIAITTPSTKADPNLEFSETNVSATIGETFTPPTLTYANGYDGKITYASSNSAINVNENTGAVSFDESAAGESATITATASATDNYTSGTASYVLTVVDPNTIQGNLNNETFGSNYIGSITPIASFTSVSGQIEDVTVTYAKGSSSSAYINDDEIRLYNGIELIFTAPSGYFIRSLTFNNELVLCESSRGSISGSMWSSGDDNVSSVTITRVSSSGNVRLKTVTISLAQDASAIAKPTITPSSGTYTSAQTVTITNNAEGATVYYTTDGSVPTVSSSVYSNPFELNKNGKYTVKAIAINGDEKSGVATSNIVINIHVDAPVFTETDGTTFSEPYTIHLTAAQGTTIYYTTGTASPLDENGNLSGNAKVYNATTGIANLTNAMTINVVAIDKWGNVSEITTAKYKYVGEVTLPYYENFDEGLGNFTTYPTSTGKNELKWEFTETKESDIPIYGEIRKYARIKGGTNSPTSDNSYKNFVGNDYLVSPVIDISNLTGATLNFIHAGHFFGTGSDTNTDGTDNLAAKKASCKLYVRDVTNGVPTDVTTGWTDISDRISNWFYQQNSSNGGLFPRVNSGDISLNDFIEQGCEKVQISFYFTTDATKGGYWNVLKFAVTGTQEEEVVNYESVNMKTDGYITYVVKNDINWDATMKMNAGVYGYKVIQFTEAAKGGNGTTVLVELGNDEEMAVDEEKTETPLTDEQKKPLWSEKITPAGTPIILKGHAGDNLLVIAKSDDVIPSVKGNLLKPSFGDVQGSSAQTLYVLQKTSDWVDTDPYNNYLFYKLANGRQIPDRKAYLNGADASEEIIYYLANKPDAQGPDDPVSPHAKQNFIILSHTESEQLVSEDAGIPDGIEAVSGDSETKDRVFYSISGVKVSNPTKGIYILNGKKVIVK